VSAVEYRIEIDRRACIGSGMCTASAPDRFLLDGGRAAATSDLPFPADENVLDAAESCPAEAILVRDAASGKVLAPED